MRQREIREHRQHRRCDRAPVTVQSHTYSTYIELMDELFWYMVTKIHIMIRDNSATHSSMHLLCTHLYAPVLLTGVLARSDVLPTTCKINPNDLINTDHLDKQDDELVNQYQHM